MILWRSQDQDGSDAGIFAQLFTDDRVPFGGEFQVNSFTLGAQDDVSATVDAGGGLVAVWESEVISGSVGRDGSDDGVFAQRLDSEGLPAGEEFQVNAFTIGPQDGAGAVATADGFLVVWESQGQDGAGDGIFGRRFRFDP